MQTLQKQAKNLRTVLFVVIIMVIRNRCESRTLYGSPETMSHAVAWIRDWWLHDILRIYSFGEMYWINTT